MAPEKIIQCGRDWKRLKVYNSIAEAAKAMDVSESAIRRALKYSTLSCGYHWERVN